MTNTEELKQQELSELTNDYNLEDLEDLIISGTDARIPVVFELELFDKKQKKMVVHNVSCNLKPLTNTEVQNAQRIAYKSTTTTLQIEILKKGMFGINDDKPFNQKLIEKLPTGVVDNLAEKLLDISGVKLEDEQQRQLAEQMMGF